MLAEQSRKVHRYLTLLLAVVFATATSTSISAQPRTPTGSQSPATEAPFASGTRQPVQAFGGQLAVLLGHEDDITSAVFSPDGRHILTASLDKTTRLWDTKGNLLTVLRGHEGGVTSAVFSHDGHQFLTTSGDREARLWDNKGNLLAKFGGDEYSVASAVFSPDGRRILTVSVDMYGTPMIAHLWDAKGKLLAKFEWVGDAVFSPDGRHILTVSNLYSDDKTFHLWDIKGNLLAKFGGDKYFVASAVFSPDGRHILTAGKDARLWDIKGNLLVVFEEGNKYSLNSGVFSPDGRHILTIGADTRLWDSKANLLTELPEINARSAVFSPDGRQILTTGRDARLWDIKGNLLAELEFQGSRFSSAVFSPDGRQILSFSDGTARLWDVSATIAFQAEQIAALQTFQQGVSKKNVQLAELRGHQDFVISAVFSPDGHQILTASDDKTARLWDSKGNLLAVLRGHQERVTRVVFSPDGSQILTASSLDGIARLWDSKGNLLAELRGHQSGVNSAVFSPDGSQILTTGRDARLWDSKGNLLAVLQGYHNAVFSPDGSQILTTGRDARLWDSKGNLLAVLQGHKRSVNRAVFSPDGNQILTASLDETARLWDSKGNLLAFLQGDEGLVYGAIFSPDGSQILTTYFDNFRLSDNKGNLLAVLGEDEEGVYSAVFSPDGSQILTSSKDKTARLWDNKGNLLAVLRGHEGGVKAVFNSDGSQILTASSDKTARLWDVSAAIASQSEQMAALRASQQDLSNDKTQLAELRGHEGKINSAVFSPDGRQILTASNDKTARLWDSKGNLLAKLGGYEGGFTSAGFSPDGSQILTTSDDGTVRLWDSKGNLLAVLQGHQDRVNSAVFSPDGSQILTASDDGTVRLWDSKGNFLAVLQGHEGGFTSAVFSPDGSQILTASYDNTARLWDNKGNLLAELRGHEASLTRAVFSPDGRQILTASQDYTARLWDTKGNLLKKFDGYMVYVSALDHGEGMFTSVVFSPDGRQILTLSGFQIRLWDNKGNLLGELRGYNLNSKTVTSALFSPDGRQILTASQDYTARLWDVSAVIHAYAPERAFQEAIQLNQQGTIKSRQLAIQKLQESLKLYGVAGNQAKEAQVLLSMGQIYTNLGQFQTALDSYNQALPLSRQAGAKAEEAAILNSLGQLYTDLADPKTALDYYKQALPLWYQLNDKGDVATTLKNIGDIQAISEEWLTALKSYNQALIVSRYGGNLTAEASSLMSIGSIYTTSKEWATALNAYNQALLISRFLNDKVKQTTILNQLGKIHAALGQNSTAIEHYNQALSLSQQLGYKTEEAHIFYNQAILNHRQNNLTAAKTEIEAAINIIEELRTQIASQQLRQSYFARNQDYYQFYIDLLMQLHQQNPTQGYDAQALQISERARARSLIELLTEANADIRAGVDPQLLEQERNLTQQLNDLEYRKYQLLSTQHSQQELEEIQQKIDTQLNQLKQLEAKIRIASPQYANLKYPEPLTLQQIQQQVIDEDTVLLEYSLGEDRSYLWAVTKNNITSYQLPPRSSIETAAQSFFRLTTDKNATLDEILPASTQLTQLILPNLAQLSQKRLLIVPDGQLHYIPFSALSINPSDYQPLLTKHQIIHLPSASTVAINRNQLTQRAIAPNTLAIIADPIFSPNDSRLTGKTNPSPNNNRGTEDLAQLSLERSATTSELNLKPLPYTRTEADTILQLLQGKSSLSFFEFDANLNTVKRPDLSNYQIIHFATHGILNPDYPELSGLVVSLVDRQGKPQNGFLRLNDIFNLNLPAELVVLSACQTGSGKNVKGEGIVGLTRGFMYAGSPRVIASLWNVNDASTAQLMKLFYQKYLQENLPPAEALRQAQLAMWQSNQVNWRTPYFWAAFTLQGEWR